jgi:hypothetical protein
MLNVTTFYKFDLVVAEMYLVLFQDFGSSVALVGIQINYEGCVGDPSFSL